MEVKWDDAGLAPAVVQDLTDGTVLMVAWVNQEALKQTEETGFAHFYSRSRQGLWKKGESSGNVIKVHEVWIDCDRDTLIYLSEASGPACHTGRDTCFFTSDQLADLRSRDKAVPLAHIMSELSQTIDERKTASAGKSYVKSLLQGGASKINSKILEEAGELTEEIAKGQHEKTVYEAADLMFHTMVGLAHAGVHYSEVLRELERRFGTSGHVEKASR